MLARGAAGLLVLSPLAPQICLGAAAYSPYECPPRTRQSSASAIRCATAASAQHYEYRAASRPTRHACDALRIALLTRDGAEIRHWADDGSLPSYAAARTRCALELWSGGEGAHLFKFADLDDAQIDKFQEGRRIGLRGRRRCGVRRGRPRAVHTTVRAPRPGRAGLTRRRRRGERETAVKRADGKVSVGLLDDEAARYKCEGGRRGDQAGDGAHAKRTARAFQPRKKRRRAYGVNRRQATGALDGDGGGQ